jgi:hypothetical protein
MIASFFVSFMIVTPFACEEEENEEEDDEDE